ncbi:hypothetical protein EDB83DRAFT_2557537 [Lactarius deliciosus]|nr:hypothetical protein EDB83DRAFT_2557537 [Lactarius deliciosus]
MQGTICSPASVVCTCLTSLAWEAPYLLMSGVTGSEMIPLLWEQASETRGGDRSAAQASHEVRATTCVHTTSPTAPSSAGACAVGAEFERNRRVLFPLLPVDSPFPPPFLFVTYMHFSTVFPRRRWRHGGHIATGTSHTPPLATAAVTAMGPVPSLPFPCCNVVTIRTAPEATPPCRVEDNELPQAPSLMAPPLDDDVRHNLKRCGLPTMMTPRPRTFPSSYPDPGHCHRATITGVSRRRKMGSVKCLPDRDEEDTGDDDGPSGWERQRMNGRLLRCGCNNNYHEVTTTTTKTTSMPTARRQRRSGDDPTVMGRK